MNFDRITPGRTDSLDPTPPAARYDDGHKVTHAPPQTPALVGQRQLETRIKTDPLIASVTSTSGR